LREVLRKIKCLVAEISHTALPSIILSPRLRITFSLSAVS
jgi:hypothetical protein